MDVFSFEREIEDFIASHGLLEKGRPVVTALSGGADSVALLSVLSSLGYECVAAHCNFHLRGAESNRDMRFCQNLCNALGVDFYVKDFDVDARRQATGESVEMACRSLRYEWFDTIVDSLRAQAVAVGHHRDDQEETFFLNLLRRSSVHGLGGMRPRNGFVVRPLLCTSRAEILKYLGERRLGYVTDSTNAECDFRRNRLRNIVLPVLHKEFPEASDAIIASMAHIADNRDLLDSLVAERAARYTEGDVIFLYKIIASERHPRALLYEMLRPMGFNASQVADIIASAGASGRTFSTDTATVELSRGILVMTKGKPETGDCKTAVSLRRDILTPVHIAVTEHDVAEFRPERNPSVAYFDSAIASQPLTLRHWHRGDRIRPYGMNGSRLVSDLFSDAKYSAWQKRTAWLLTSGDTVRWAVGLRQSDSFPVTPATRRYLRLELRTS